MTTYLKRISGKILVLVCSLLLLNSLPLLALAQADIPASQVQTSSLSIEQLQQAAEAGDPDAQYALGYLYYSGKNVTQDTALGLNWIKRASVQGQEQAIAAMRMLAPASAGSTANPPLQTATTNPTTSTQTVESVATANPGAGSPINNAASSPQLKAPAPAVAEVPEMANAPGNYYTIQLLVTSNKAELDRYIHSHSLGKQVHYVVGKKNGHDSYSLLYGVYKTRAEAQASLLKMPASVKAEKPWIKKISQVKGSGKK